MAPASVLRPYGRSVLLQLTHDSGHGAVVVAAWLAARPVLLRHVCVPWVANHVAPQRRLDLRLQMQGCLAPWPRRQHLPPPQSESHNIERR